MSRNVRKLTLRHVYPMRTQISQHSSVVWSEYLLSAWRNLASLTIQNVPSEDSDQTAQMRRLVWMFAVHTCRKVCFLEFAAQIINSRWAVHKLYTHVCTWWIYTLMLSMLGKSFRRHFEILFLVVVFFFFRKQILTFHANCFQWWHFAWNVKSSFLGKIRKVSPISRLLN